MSEVAAPVTAPATPAPAEPAKQAHVNVPPAPKGVEFDEKPAPKMPAEAPKTAPVAAIDEDPEYEIAVDGKKQKLRLSELKRRASLADAANSRFEEAAKMRNQAEKFLSKLRDPKQAIALLEDPSLGLNPQEIRTAFEDWYAERFIQREQMTPEQRELADAKKRLQEYEEREAAERRKQEELAMQEQDKQLASSLQKEIMGIIEQSNLPKTRFIASRIAYWTRINEAKGIKAPAELIVQQVQNEQRQILKDLVETADGELLHSTLGETAAKKLSQYHIKLIREGKMAKKAPEPEPLKKAETKERLTEADIKRRMRTLW